MRLFFFALLFLNIHACISQNLVSNGSFEIHSECPEYPPEDFSIDQITLADGWTQPTLGSSDYFHICGEDEASIPDGLFGYQFPSLDGDSAFAGIQTFFTVESTFREYVSYEIPDMEIGETYNVTLDVNIGELGSVFSDCLGVNFKTASWEYELFDIELIHDAQIDYSSFGIMDNTETWLTVTDSFVADSVYTELTVGCFKDESEVSFDASGSGTNPSSYVLLDNLCITKPTGSCSETVGTNESFLDDLVVNPNPTNGVFSFNYSGYVKVYNSLGQIVFESYVNKKETIELLDQPPGLYTLDFEFQGLRKVKKLMVR